MIKAIFLILIYPIICVNNTQSDKSANSVSFLALKYKDTPLVLPKVLALKERTSKKDEILTTTK